MVTLAGEEDIVKDLHLGLSLAVRDHEDLDDDALDYLGETKLHKLFYYSVDEFDLPVTYSWYLAGAHLAVENVSVDILKKTHSSINRPIHSKQDFVDNRVQTKSETNVFDYRDYFLEIIYDVWYTPLNGFLTRFYEEHAPPQYKPLYLSSLELRKIFQFLIDELANIMEDSRQFSLSEFGDIAWESRASDIVDNFNKAVRNIELELANDSELTKTAEEFSRFRTVAENIIRQISGIPHEDVSERHLEIIEETDSFYFNHAWRYPCLIISKNTASGPQKKSVILSAEKRLKDFREDYIKRFNQFQEDCIAAGVDLRGQDEIESY